MVRLATRFWGAKMTINNALRWLIKIALFAVVIDILVVVACCGTPNAPTPTTDCRTINIGHDQTQTWCQGWLVETDIPVPAECYTQQWSSDPRCFGTVAWPEEKATPIYLPQTVPQAGYLAGCPQPGKWAVSTWSGPETEISTAIATCYPTAIDAVYFLDPTTNGWKTYFRNRPELTTLHEVFHMQGLITYASPTLAQIHDEPTVYWPTLLDGEITFYSDSSIADWAEEIIEQGWQIEATNTQSDHADVVITVQDSITYDGSAACGLAGMDYETHICYVTLSRWCFDTKFIYDDVPEKTLLHEVGHCMGLDHRANSVMSTPIQNWTTEDDIEEIHMIYGLR